MVTKKNGVLEQQDGNVKELNKQDLNYELIKRKPVKDSPFIVVDIEGRCFGAMGEYRITEEKESVEEVREELNKITWDRIVQVCMILIEKNIDINKIKE